MSLPLTLRSAASRAAFAHTSLQALRASHRIGSASRLPERNTRAATKRLATTSAGVETAQSGHSAQSQGHRMPIEDTMREKLQREFSPEVLNIRNDSAKHAHHAAMVAQGGGSGETHFFVEVVATSFEGKTQIARHRAVNALMKDEFDQGLHALSLRTKTPAEAEKEKEWIKAQSAGRS